MKNKLETEADQGARVVSVGVSSFGPIGSERGVLAWHV